MSAEELRRRVVRVVIPLIGEYETLTMARIAGAAGIGEAELRAVFADKEAVVQACMSAMVAHISAVSDPAAEVRRMEAIRVDQPVAARLLEVIGVLGDYYERVRTELETLEPGGDQALSGQDFRALGSLPEIRPAVVRLLRPEEEHLRLPAEALAEIFLGLTRFCTRAPNEEQPMRAEDVVDLFLHGADTREAPRGPGWQ
ncbi:AcrR family transcriptional regulator [Actinoplanes tereljensis]|uniref:TetR family transcriptional regulator n=1 Tax=Paractinoplanes tereljensis TaxID=571912 RepID=A0A919NQT2_9ACTN|nr:hypothetical protein [Actinoplanes tereljensis]GIF22361.1 TetR family transcriptional regulator [Actinoplanes tereljensis]